MPRDLSVKNPELLGDNKVTETQEVETTNQNETVSSYWTKEPSSDTLPQEWERSDGLRVIRTKKSSYMVVLADGTELRGPKGRLRTWRDMDKVREVLDIEHPLR